jgi:hypothetical protein
MASSRRTRRRRQQRSFQRHQLRLEGLEKRSMLTASSTLDESSLLTVGDNASPQDDQTAYVSMSDAETVANATSDTGSESSESFAQEFYVSLYENNLYFFWNAPIPPIGQSILYHSIEYRIPSAVTWTHLADALPPNNDHIIDANSTGLDKGQTYVFRLCPYYVSGMGPCTISNSIDLTNISPVITSVTAPADGVYRSGDTLSFSVNFDEEVNVDVAAGTPGIALNLGPDVHLAEYVSGTGTSTLVFQYDIQENDIDADGIWVQSLIHLNGGVIRNSAERDAILTFTPLDTTGVLVNVNRTPLLDASLSPQLNPVNENSGAPIGAVGTLVSNLIDSGGALNNFSDADGDLPGIAITGLNLNGGRFWFSQDDGVTWQIINSTTSAMPLLLEADQATRIYFEPPPEFSGVIGDLISFKAWDRTRRISQLGFDLTGEQSREHFGYSVALSDDARTVAVGAIYNDSKDTNAGQVRVFRLSESTWVQIGDDINGESSHDRSGSSVSLSSDGSTLAVGAYWNNGNGQNSGHVRIYRLEGGSWIQVGDDIDGEYEYDKSGLTLSLSADGETVAIGARYNDDNGTNTGHVRVYRLDGSSWSQVGADIDGESSGDESGYALSLSADGETVAIGARFNDGAGIDAGHVRVYRLDGSSWSQVGADIDGESSGDESGYALSLSADGETVAIGARYNDGAGIDAGHVRVYRLNGSSWSQVGADIDGESSSGESGSSIGISSDGTTVVIGAPLYNTISEEEGKVQVFRINGAENCFSENIDTASITVAPVNRRPVLTPSVASQLSPVTEDAGVPVGAVGTLVSSLIDSGGVLNNFSDADGDLPGIAIVGTSLQGGALYYSIDNGTTWSDVGVVSPISARLLYADDSTRLYFKPAPDFNGTISDVLTCKAWDRTGGFNNGDAGVDTSIITWQESDVEPSYSYAEGVALSEDNNYAYVTDNIGLSVVDISDRSNPRVVNSLQTNGQAKNIVLSQDGNYAFIADYRNGVLVIEITNQRHLEEVANIPLSSGLIRDIGLSESGDTVYAIKNTGEVLVIDVRNPATSFVVKTIALNEPAYNLDVSGNYLNIAHGGKGITTLEITDPLDPVVVADTGLYGLEAFSPYVNGIKSKKNGQYLYTATNHLSVFKMFDDDPTVITPVIVNTSWLPNLAGSPGGWNITLSDNEDLMIVSGRRSGACIYDVSVPSRPVLLSSLEFNGLLFDTAITDDDNYLAGVTGSSFLTLVDITNKSSPQEISNVKNSSVFAEQRRITKDGRYEFRAWNTKLEVYDLQGTRKRVHIHELAYSLPWRARNVILSPDDRFAFVRSTGNGVEIIDVTNPSSMVTVALIPHDLWSYDINLSSDGQTIIVMPDNGWGSGVNFDFSETTAFSLDMLDVGVAVTPVNDRPILDPTASPVLFTQATGADQPVGKVGTLVSKLIDDAGPLNNFSDVDGDLPGIAMIGTNLGGGILWFSTDEGDNWTQVSQVSGQAATLLAADNKTRIYLQLGPDAESRPDTVVTFKAWDRNGYPNGAQGVDTSTESYFSEQQDDITLDKPANILGDLSGVLTVGRVARGQFIWSDPDGSQFLSHDEWTRLTGGPEVIVPPEHGDATILGRWSHDDQYWVTWFYDASPYFSGSDSFVIRLKDEVGGHTDQTISVTGEPGPLNNYPPTVDDLGPIGKTEDNPHPILIGDNSQLTLTGISYGNDLQPQDIRVSAVSDNGDIVAEVQYTSPEARALLDFSLSQSPPERNTVFQSAITITIEDTGIDNNFLTSDDNATTEFIYYVMWIHIPHMPPVFTQDGVNLTFSSDWGVLVNGIPVSMITSNHSPQTLSASGIGDFRPVEATSDGGDNYLLLHRGQTLNRLAANSEWQVTNLFDSLRNESSEILDVSGRAVSQTIIVAAGIGAYEINGVNTPTLFVRRNQTVTFNLNTQGMPLYVQTTSTGYQASEMYSAFDANGQSSGQYEWVIPEDAPDELFYTMEFQPEGLGKIIVVD